MLPIGLESVWVMNHMKYSMITRMDLRSNKLLYKCTDRFKIGLCKLV